MIAELGNFALVIALMMAMLLSIYPLWGAQRNHSLMMATARPLAVGMFIFTAFAYACLTHAFIENDFTLWGHGIVLCLG